MKYYIVENTGKGFITAEENETSFIKNVYNDIYETDNEEWANRVGAIELSEEELQYFRDEKRSNHKDSLTYRVNIIQNDIIKEKLMNWLDTI